MKIRLGGQTISLEELVQLWPVIFTLFVEDDGTLEPGDALVVLRRIGKVMKRKKAQIMTDVLKNKSSYCIFFERILKEVKELVDHIDPEECELDGDEELDSCASQGWLRSYTGPGSLVTPEIAKNMHEFMEKSGIVAERPDPDEEGSYVMVVGPVQDFMDPLLVQ